MESASESAGQAGLQGLRFREACDADAPGIRAIIARIYADYGDVLDIEREDPHLRDPCTYFRADGGQLWVAESDAGVLAGSGAVLIKDGTAEIKTVYVAREFRRRGIARRLVTLALDHARGAAGKGARVTLWSDTRFVEAHRLYESMGFVRTGLRHISIVNTFSEYRYELELGGVNAA